MMPVLLGRDLLPLERERERDQLQTIINRAKRWKLDGGTDLPTISNLFDTADALLFAKICKDCAHVLSPTTTHSYQLRQRSRKYQLCYETSSKRKHFITRMTFKDIY